MTGAIQHLRYPSNHFPVAASFQNPGVWGGSAGAYSSCRRAKAGWQPLGKSRVHRRRRIMYVSKIIFFILHWFALHWLIFFCILYIDLRCLLSLVEIFQYKLFLAQCSGRHCRLFLHPCVSLELLLVFRYVCVSLAVINTRARAVVCVCLCVPLCIAHAGAGC